MAIQPTLAHPSHLNPYARYSNKEWRHEMKKSLTGPSGFTLFKYCIYAISFAYIEIVYYSYRFFKGENKKRALFNQVIKTHQASNTALFLGSIPVRKRVFSSRNDVTNLRQNHNIQAVLSVVERFENNARGLFTTPTPPTDWKKHKVKQLQLPTRDGFPVDVDLVEKGVEFIHWNLKNHRSVYVHCKAGQERSGITVLCYLIKYQKMSVQQALAFLKEQRPQLNLNKKKLRTAYAFEKRLRRS